MTRERDWPAEFEDLLRVDGGESLDQERDDARPANLMAGADASTRLALEYS